MTFQKILLALVLISFTSFGQTPNSNDIIKASIKYHDPQGEWEGLDADFVVLSDRDTAWLHLANLRSMVEWKEKLKDGRYITGGYQGDSCFVKIDDKLIEPKGQIDNLLLDCPQIIGRSNYWLYMYGLPMKLKDEQAVIDPKPEKVNFLDNQYWRIKVHYNNPDGERWQFYFDTDSYRFAIAQYFHPALGDDNEYIIFDTPIQVGTMVLPSKHNWYMYNKKEYIGFEQITIPNEN